MKKKLPSKNDVILKIESMMRSIETREEVSAWAIAIVDDDSIELTDMSLWKILKNLGGADLINDDGSYLYSNEDFSDWKAEILK